MSGHSTPGKERRTYETCGRCGIEMKTDGYFTWCPVCTGDFS